MPRAVGRRSPASSLPAPSGRSTPRSAPTPSLELRPDPRCRLEINTLADVDAADVIAFRVAGDRVRYAVSLRARRITAQGDTLVARAVMVWDSAGAWQQAIFRPTLLALRGGRLAP